EVHRLALALMKQRAKLGFAKHAGQLVIGAEIGGREGRECGRIENRRLTHRRHELSRTIDDECRPGTRVGEEYAQDVLDAACVFLAEGPARGAAHAASPWPRM